MLYICLIETSIRFQIPKILPIFNIWKKSQFLLPFYIFMPAGIKKYDFYRKAIDGLQTKTSIGGLSKLSYSSSFIVSVISAIIIAILISMQTYSFFQTKTSTTLNVDSQMDSIIPTTLDFSLFYMSCECIQSIHSLYSSCWSSLREY